LNFYVPEKDGRRTLTAVQTGCLRSLHPLQRRPSRGASDAVDRGEASEYNVN
jgi:hypothetical protein